MKKLAIAAAILVIALAASAFTFAPAAHAPTPQAGTPTVTFSGTIHLTKMGLYLNDRGNSSTKGAVVQVWAANGGAAEVWQVMSDGTIRHNGLCLDVVGAKKTKGGEDRPLDLQRRCQPAVQHQELAGYEPSVRQSAERRGLRWQRDSAGAVVERRHQQRGVGGGSDTEADTVGCLGGRAGYLAASLAA